MTQSTNQLPPRWVQIQLGDLKPGRNESIDPRRAPDEPFEIYSVPAFPLGTPEIVRGSQIGSSKQKVEPGMVLLCGINPRINRVWIVSEPNCKQQIASTEWIAFPRTPGIDPKYLSYFLQRNEVRDYLAGNASGVGGSLMRVKGRTCAEITFPVAPNTEQSRIVAEIEKQFTQLDAAVAALKRVQANLKRYRATVLKAACEGRLVPTEAELARRENRSYEPASVLLERILAERRSWWESTQLMKFRSAGKIPSDDKWKARYKAPLQVGSIANPDLPEGWTWCTADQLCAQITDGEHIQPPYTAMGYPLLSAKHVRFGFVTLDDAGLISKGDFDIALARCAPQENDLLIVSVGATTGRAAVVGSLPQFAIVRSVLLLKPLIDSYYFWGWTQSPDCQSWIKQASGATAQPHLYIKDTMRMLVPLPAMAEISRIKTELGRRLSVIDEIEIQLKIDLARAERTRQAILKRAFEGKLAPQDPNDEPASVLLERIRSTATPGCAPLQRESKKPNRPLKAKETVHA